MVDLVDREIVVHRQPLDGVFSEIAPRRDGLLGVPGGGTALDVRALFAVAG